MLKDNEMLAKVSCVDFLAREVHYHNIYRLRYQVKAEALSKKDRFIDNIPQDQWHVSSEIHSTAFNVVCKFIDEHIVGKNKFHILLN